MSDAGRPPVEEETYKAWLEAMSPYLENSNSLYYAIKQAGLIHHKSLIFQKYNLKDWFMEKVDDLRREPGELVNDGIVTQIRAIVKAIKRGESPTADENKLLMFYAEKSRAAQGFYVNRYETAPAKPIDELLSELDSQGGSIDDVASEAAKQMVETQPPIQD